MSRIKLLLALAALTSLNTAVSETIEFPTGSGVVYQTITSPNTGRIWLDRNLGAERVASAYNDFTSFGDYYQWGRGADGHEKCTNNQSGCNTTTKATTITPAHSGFIVNNFDWTTDGVDEDGSKRILAWANGGANAICPPDFRVPTLVEFAADTTEATIYKVTDRNSAFDSFLKLPTAGVVKRQFGKDFAGQRGYYWTSSPQIGNDDTYKTAYALYLLSDPSRSSAYFNRFNTEIRRSSGLSVRCIKDPATTGAGANSNGVTQSRRAITIKQGEQATYTVTLARQPLDEVQFIAKSNSASVDALATLNFSIYNWHLPQNITVTGVSDGTAQIGYTFDSKKTGGYGNVVVPNVEITVGQHKIDINADGATDIEDAQLLVKYLFGSRGRYIFPSGTTDADIAAFTDGITTDLSALDVDGVAGTNSKDGTLILRYLLYSQQNPSGTIPCPDLTNNQADNDPSNNTKCVAVKSAIELLLKP